MKLEQLRLPLIPRTTMNCLDLGALFFGRHVGTIVVQWLWYAIPTCLLVYLAATYWEWDLRFAALLVHFVSAPFGVLLAERLVHAAFGESFEAPPATPERTGRLLSMGIKSLGARLATLLLGFALILPGWWVGVRTSFIVEKNCLAELAGRSHDRRNQDLVKQEIGSLLQRSFVIFLFLLGLSLAMLFCVDFLSATLFNVPILMGRVGESISFFPAPDDYLRLLIEYLVADPLVMTVLTGVWLLLYPIARFAWFFCYIDLRVRGDFWDLELQFQKELERLGEAGA